MWTYNTELYHHGIKGQKWGVRRFQNEDGSLTDAGKKRYAKQLIRDIKKAAPYVSGGNYASIYKKNSRLLENPILRQISNDPRIKKLDEDFERKVSKLSGKDASPSDYNPFDDPKLISEASKQFEKDMGRAPDPDNYQDDKALGYYIDYLNQKSHADHSTAYDRAFDQYYSARNKIVGQELFSLFGNRKVVLGGTRSLFKDTARARDIVKSLLNTYEYGG